MNVLSNSGLSRGKNPSNISRLLYTIVICQCGSLLDQKHHYTTYTLYSHGASISLNACFLTSHHLFISVYFTLMWAKLVIACTSVIMFPWWNFHLCMNYVLVMHNVLMEFHFFPKQNLRNYLFLISLAGNVHMFDASI